MSPKPISKRAVREEGSLVIKLQDPDASRRERLRTQAGHAVGRETGLFVVPEIVSFDDSRGEIVFQRLQLTGIREVLSKGSRTLDLVGTAAASLAAIHRQMETSSAPAEGHQGGVGVGLERKLVPLHGDFGMRNLFCIADSDRLVIIDWSNADWIGVEAELGTPETDIAVFLISLFHRRLFGPWPVSRRHELARHFLRSYASAAPDGFDVDVLRDTVAATRPGFNRRHRRHKGTLRALGYRHSMIDLEFFLRRLSGQRG